MYMPTWITSHENYDEVRICICIKALGDACKALKGGTQTNADDSQEMARG
jgi:hypothetical protein